LAIPIALPTPLGGLTPWYFPQWFFGGFSDYLCQPTRLCAGTETSWPISCYNLVPHSLPRARCKTRFHPRWCSPSPVFYLFSLLVISPSSPLLPPGVFSPSFAGCDHPGISTNRINFSPPSRQPPDSQVPLAHPFPGSLPILCGCCPWRPLLGPTPSSARPPAQALVCSRLAKSGGYSPAGPCPCPPWPDFCYFPACEWLGRVRVSWWVSSCCSLLIQDLALLPGWFLPFAACRLCPLCCLLAPLSGCFPSPSPGLGAFVVSGYVVVLAGGRPCFSSPPWAPPGPSSRNFASPGLPPGPPRPVHCGRLFCPFFFLGLPRGGFHLAGSCFN